MVQKVSIQCWARRGSHENRGEWNLTSEPCLSFSQPPAFQVVAVCNITTLVSQPRDPVSNVPHCLSFSEPLHVPCYLVWGGQTSRWDAPQNSTSLAHTVRGAAIGIFQDPLRPPPKSGSSPHLSLLGTCFLSSEAVIIFCHMSVTMKCI